MDQKQSENIMISVSQNINIKERKISEELNKKSVEWIDLTCQNLSKKVTITRDKNLKQLIIESVMGNNTTLKNINFEDDKSLSKEFGNFPFYKYEPEWFEDLEEEFYDVWIEKFNMLDAIIEPNSLIDTGTLIKDDILLSDAKYMCNITIPISNCDEIKKQLKLLDVIIK